jgi:hypothetical protein
MSRLMSRSLGNSGGRTSPPQELGGGGGGQAGIFPAGGSGGFSEEFGSAGLTGSSGKTAPVMIRPVPSGG